MRRRYIEEKLVDRVGELLNLFGEIYRDRPRLVLKIERICL